MRKHLSKSAGENVHFAIDSIQIRLQSAKSLTLYTEMQGEFNIMCGYFGNINVVMRLQFCTFATVLGREDTRRWTLASGVI